MFRRICRAKIHRAKVTKTDLNYEGSITIAKELLSASGMLPNEIVQVININTGERFDTYIIEGKKGTGAALNGGAARKGEVGDLLIILSYAFADETEVKKIKPRIISLDKNNRIIKIK